MSGVYVAISGHGFGHAARTASILSELKARQPELELHLVTTVPEWFLRTHLNCDFHYRGRALDVGVIQSDSLQMDISATLTALENLERNRKELIAEESRYIRENRLRLVVGDIPPLSVDIAQAADVAAVMIGNFGWDFIYEAFGKEFAPHVEKIRNSYSRSALLCQLPFCETMNSFPEKINTGVTGQLAVTDIVQLRQQLNLPADVEIVFILFGGMGLNNIPYQRLSEFDGKTKPRRHFLTFQSDAPDLPNLTTLDGQKFRASQLFGLCERILTKPGYGILADAYQNNTGLVALERAGFAETPILEESLRQHFHSRIVSVEELYHGEWSFITEKLQKPVSGLELPRDGSRTIANAIWRFIN